MGKQTRWFAILVSLFIACAVLQAAPTHKKKRTSTSHRTTHHYRHRRHYRRRHYYHRRVRLPRAPSRERTTQIQTALARGGYYKGDPNGRWDASTVAAVERFQSANNIDVTGKLDAPTLQKLGLGSDIAGVAAPKPVVPKDCCSAGPVVSSSAARAKPVGVAKSTPAAEPQNSTAGSQKTDATSTTASAAAAIAPSVNSSASGASGPAAAAKPVASQH